MLVYQSLPRQQPGEVADIHDAPDDRRIVASDGTELRPKGPIQRQAPTAAVPIFAERGGVIVHPGVQRTRGNWRFVHSASFDDLDAWERRLRRRLITAVTAIIGLLAFIAFWVVASLDGDPPRMGRGIGNGIGGLVLTILAGVAAWRSRRALRIAREARGPGRPMLVSLWWTTGYGQGPVAVAALRDVDAPDAPPVAEVPVVGLSDDMEQSSPVVGEVVGDPQDAPLIKIGDRLLWPAQRRAPRRSPMRSA